MSLSRHHGALTKPRKVEEIVREAQDFEFSPNRSLPQWLRAAKMLLTEAAICEEDGRIQDAYLYLCRHAELILAKLKEHPDYKDPRFKTELALARKSVARNLAKLEEWKPRINQEYQMYANAMERRYAERQRAQDRLNQAASQYQTYDGSRRGSRASLESQSPISPTQSLNAFENRDFAVELVQREIRRRDATRQSTRRAGIPAAEVASRRQGIVGQDYEDSYGRVSDGVREAGQHLYGQPQPSSSSRRSYQQPSSSTYQYPSVPQKERRMDWNTPPLQPSPLQSTNGAPPARPAKEALYEYQTYDLPSRPPKYERQTNELPSRPPKETLSPAPQPAPNNKKYTFHPSAYTEAGSPLRTVFLPPDLRTAFLNLADPNTSQNLETCGILCATLISNALFINTLIIPDQTSTSDTCDTTDTGDAALFDYCDTNNLLVCGWIHTHPSQSCFLSSRDLHTSSGYQVMLPEAIAIVCSPRHVPDWGIFRLTDPPGLPHVLECTQKGLFHPHSEGNLYTDALKPGHVVEGPGLQFRVVDLREKK